MPLPAMIWGRWDWTPLSLVRQCQEMMSAVLPAGGQSVKRNGHHCVGPYAPDAMLSKSAGGQ